MKRVFVLALALVSLISCSSDDYGNNDNPHPGPSTENLVRLRSDGNFGNVLTDQAGFTLYFFAPDASGDATCFGGCVDAWPVFFAENLTLDSGLDAADFGDISRADGGRQTTYKGWPLYRFANDPESVTNAPPNNPASLSLFITFRSQIFYSLPN